MSDTILHFENDGCVLQTGRQDNFSQLQSLPEINIWLEMYGLKLVAITPNVLELKTEDNKELAQLLVDRNELTVMTFFPEPAITYHKDFLITVGKMARCWQQDGKVWEELTAQELEKVLEQAY